QPRSKSISPPVSRSNVQSPHRISVSVSSVTCSSMGMPQRSRVTVSPTLSWPNFSDRVINRLRADSRRSPQPRRTPRVDAPALLPPSTDCPSAWTWPAAEQSPSLQLAADTRLILSTCFLHHLEQPLE